MCRVHGCHQCLWRSAPGFDKQISFPQRSIADEIHFTRVIIQLRTFEQEISDATLSLAERVAISERSYLLALSVQDMSEIEKLRIVLKLQDAGGSFEALCGFARAINQSNNVFYSKLAHSCGVIRGHFHR